ncbi:MAG: GTPase domain-containing protein [Clostridia bacterium]|nr:GTPase domain-containing protein [Clostridia bacterium]
MKKQPAYKGYFFSRGYKDVFNIIKKAWRGVIFPFISEFERLGELFSANFFIAIINVICDLAVFPIFTILLFSLNLLFSASFLVFVFVVGIFVYLGYSILYLTDLLFRVVKGIVSQCPLCQQKVRLPSYLCPTCKAKHTSLRPSVYGILKRKCTCGTKLPTTFFNGRQKLQSVCPYCDHNLKDGGRHVEILIPVVGGASAGKTCFITSAMMAIEKHAVANNLQYKYSPTSTDNFVRDKTAMEHGITPEKTGETRLNYYQFYLTPNGEKIKNLISLCDIAGEAYNDTSEISKQIGYKFANAFILVVDPFSIIKYKKEQGIGFNATQYKTSEFRLDDVLSSLITVLENMHCLNSKNMIKTDVVVVFNKCDYADLYNRLGAPAIKNYLARHNATEYQAQNVLCENFLIEYEESNFLNTIKSKFKSVQFFACSSLGHIENGRAFSPKGVAEPMLWIIDKVSKSIDLKKKWGKKI